MSKFKKIFLALALLIAGIFTLTACKGVDLEEAKAALEIKYAAGETATTVKSDLTLPTSLEDFEGVTITWATDKADVISAAGKVVRPDADTVVTLTATLKLEGKEPVQKVFKVTVKAKDVPQIKFSVTVPEGTEEVYLVGSLNEWNEKDPIALTKGTDGKFSVVLTLAAGEYQYKYICGKDWAFVEKNADDSELENRVINVTESTTQEDVVVKWAKVPGEVEPTELKTLLDAHYADSIAQLNFLVETDTLDLVETIGDLPVTWTSNNEAVINPTTGAVTRPAFTDGEPIFVILQAKSEGQNTVTYIVKVNQLPQTLEQKLDAELSRLLNFPSSTKPILKTNLGLDNLKAVMVDGVEVTQATWTSSSPDHLTDDGALTDYEFEGDVEVTMTVTFTYEGITKTGSVTFTVRGVMVYDGFLAMINGAEKAAKGDMVKINTGVSLYKETNDGYYLVDKDGALLFIYGKSTKPAANKLFAVKMEYDLYYASPQGKNPVFTEITGAANTVAAAEEITIENLAKKAVPSDDAPLVHQLYKVTGAKLHNFDKDDNYKTFLVPQTHTDPTVEPNKSDSLMLYYQTPGGLAVLQGLAPESQTFSKDFEYIVVVLSAFRTNNDIFAFMFLGAVDNPDDLKLSLTAVEAAEVALTQASAKIEAQAYVDDAQFTLTASETVEGKEYTIAYESLTSETVDNTGKVIAFPAIGTFVDVTIKLSTTAKDEANTPVTLEKVVKVGRPAVSKIDDIVDVDQGTQIAFEGYLVDDHSNTYTFVNPDSTRGMAIRYAKNVTKGNWYIIVAERASDYNNLVQFTFKAVIDSTMTGAVAPVNYTGALTASALMNYQSGLIAVSGLEVSVAPVNKDGTLTYTLKNAAGETMAFREQKADYVAAIEALNLQVGDPVNVTQAVVSWYKENPQFIFGIIEKVTLTPEQEFNNKVAALKESLPAAGTVYYENFSLPVDHEGLTVVWTVTEGATAAAVDAAGLVTITKGAEEETVKLKGVVTEGEFTADVIVQVIIAKEGEEPSTNVATDLFISEYIEGTSNNKAIEIYNGTGAAVNLSNYRVTLFSNGSSEHHATNIATFTIDQVLNPGETLVIYNSGSSELLKARLTHAAISITSTVTYFNGDDALALEKKNGEAWDRIDVFGVIGVDPGTNWPVGDGSTLDNTLVRNANVGSPSATWDVTQWTVKGKDFFDDLGVHTMTLE